MLYVKVFYLWSIKAIAKVIMTFKSALQIALTQFYLWSTYFEKLIQVCIKYYFIGVLWHCSQWLLKMVISHKIWKIQFVLHFTTLFLAWNCLNTYFHNQVNYLIQYTPLWNIDFSTTVCGAPWNWCPFFALVVRNRLSSLYAKWETRIKEKFYT